MMYQEHIKFVIITLSLLYVIKKHTLLYMYIYRWHRGQNIRFSIKNVWLPIKNMFYLLYMEKNL